MLVVAVKVEFTEQGRSPLCLPSMNTFEALGRGFDCFQISPRDDADPICIAAFFLGVRRCFVQKRLIKTSHSSRMLV